MKIFILKSEISLLMHFSKFPKISKMKIFKWKFSGTKISWETNFQKLHTSDTSFEMSEGQFWPSWNLFEAPETKIDFYRFFQFFLEKSKNSMRKSHRVRFQGHFGLQGSSAVTINSGAFYSMRKSSICGGLFRVLGRFLGPYGDKFEPSFNNVAGQIKKLWARNC